MYTSDLITLRLKSHRASERTIALKLSVSASNLLNDDRARQYEVFQGDPGIFSQTRAGRTFKLSFAYTLQ